MNTRNLALSCGPQGTPLAYFPDNSCNIDQFFSANNIIINLTFCEHTLQYFTYSCVHHDCYKGGDWAGSAYSGSGCPLDCTTYVDTDPAAFQFAYWDISSVRVYEPYVS